MSLLELLGIKTRIKAGNLNFSGTVRIPGSGSGFGFGGLPGINLGLISDDEDNGGGGKKKGHGSTSE